MAKITYEDKEFLNKNESIADKNKVNDTDLNQIKEVVNGNDDKIGNLSDLNTADKSSLVSAINSLKPVVLFEGNQSVASEITLKYSVENYSYIEVYATTGGGDNYLVPIVKVLKEFNKFQIVFNTSPSTGWINMNIDFSISENKITATALRQAYINNNRVVERVTTDLAGYAWNLHVVKVLGYK